MNTMLLGRMTASLMLFGPAHAAAMDLIGPDALAVAAIVGENSSSLPKKQKAILSAMADGNPLAAPEGPPFSVSAKAIRCRVSNVDITHASCELEIDGGHKSLEGSKARVTFEILKNSGLNPEGAAGSQYVIMTNLHCRISPKSVAEMDGSGMSCDFQTLDK